MTDKLIPRAKVAAIIHLNAGHTTMGNPRRGYLVIDKYGEPVAFTDEGYEGSAALRHVIRITGETRVGYGLPYPISVKTTPAELRHWRTAFDRVPA